MEAPQSAARPLPARPPSLLDPDPGPATARAIGLLAALEGEATVGAGATGWLHLRRVAAAALLAGVAVLGGLAVYGLAGPGAPSALALDKAGESRCATDACPVEQETNWHPRAFCKPCRPAPP